MARKEKIMQDVIKNSFKAVKEDISEIKDRFDTNEDKFRGFKGNIEGSLDQIISNLKEEFEKLEANLKNNLDNNEEKSNDFEIKIENCLKDIKRDFKENIKKIENDFQNKSDSNESKFVDANIKIENSLENVKEDFKREFEKLGNSIKEKSDNYENRFKELKTKISDDSETIKKGFRSDLEKLDNSIKEKLNLTNSSIKSLGVNLARFEKEINDYRRRFSDLNSQFEVKSKLVKNLNDLRRELFEIKNIGSDNKLSLEKAKALTETRLIDLKKSLNELTSESSRKNSILQGQIDNVIKSSRDTNKEAANSLEEKTSLLKKRIEEVSRQSINDYFETKKKLDEWNAEFSSTKRKVDEKMDFTSIKLNEFRVDNNHAKASVKDELEKNELKFSKRDEEFKNLVKDVFKTNEKVAVINHVYADLYTRFKKTSETLQNLEDSPRNIEKIEKKLLILEQALKNQKKLAKRDSNDKINKKEGFFKEKFEKMVDILATED